MKKITTVVAAVSVVLFVLMQFPGVSSERMEEMEKQGASARASFAKAAAKAGHGEALDEAAEVDALFDFVERYKVKRMGVADKAGAVALDARFRAENAVYFGILKPAKGDKAAKGLSRAYKKLRRVRLTLRKQIKDETIDKSFLGSVGQWLEPFTQYAGFNWRVNVSLLAALAAKENTVATLGALYQPLDVEEDEAATETTTHADIGMVPAQGAGSLEGRMAAQETGFTSLHALALMLFMALYPPCMAATMVVKVQSGSWRWMVFSLVYMICLGATVATLVFSGGTALGLDGVQAMAWFYGLALAATIVTGIIKPRTTDI